MIQTYAGLSQAILAWINNLEVTQNVGNFVSLAEAQINRRLRCREMWGFTTLNTACERAPLPADFLSVESLKGPRGKLTYISPQMMDEESHGRWGWGDAVFEHRNTYTIAGGEIVFPYLFYPGCTPPPAFPSRMRYVRRLPPLGPANTNNWLLSAHPDAYLFGSLAQTKGFLEEDERSEAWEARFTEVLEEIEAADRMTTLDTLEMRPAFGGEHRHRYGGRW